MKNPCSTCKKFVSAAKAISLTPHNLQISWVWGSNEVYADSIDRDLANAKAYFQKACQIKTGVLLAAPEGRLCQTGRAGGWWWSSWLPQEFGQAWGLRSNSMNTYKQIRHWVYDLCTAVESLWSTEVLWTLWKLLDPSWSPDFRAGEIGVKTGWMCRSNWLSQEKSLKPLLKGVTDKQLCFAVFAAEDC